MTSIVERDCPTCCERSPVVSYHIDPKSATYKIELVAVPLRRCGSCGLLYFDLIRGVNEAGEIYERMSLSSSLPKRRHRLIARILAHRKRDSQGLELGAGACHVGKLMSRDGRHQVVAVDRYPQEMASSGLTYVNADCTALPGDLFKEEEFDWILADNVLEHLPEYRQLLVNCAHWLKSDGIFFVSVPNTNTIAQHFSKQRRMQVYRPVEHVNNFSDESLDALFSGLGFHQISCRFPVSSIFDATVWLSLNWRAPFGIYKIYRKSRVPAT